MKPPHFWSSGLDPESRESAPVVRFLLSPLAGLYTWIGARKLRKASPVKVSAPVICIGNITSGGSGKTPVTQALRALLKTSGIQAASLSRGYGGSLKGPLAVSAPSHKASEVGDEPLLLAQTGPTWISADRVAGAQAMVAQGVPAILMDDGHQNPSLHKDLSLLVIDAGAPFGNGYVLPKGPLREPIASGLRRADAVILMGDGPVPQIVTVSALPVFRARLEQTAPIPTGALVAFAGIGRPERFFQALQAAGGDVRDMASFGDHHVYSPRELARLRSFAKVHDARLVTTEKDFIRLPDSERSDISPICVRAVFEDEKGLLRLLMACIEDKA